MADSNTILAGGGIGVAFSIVTFIVVRLLIPFFTAANHKRIRTVCCGKTCVSSLDVDVTTPVPDVRVPSRVAVAVPPSTPKPT